MTKFSGVAEFRYEKLLRKLGVAVPPYGSWEKRIVDCSKNWNNIPQFRNANFPYFATLDPN
jgi:hypothetical protein